VRWSILLICCLSLSVQAAQDALQSCLELAKQQAQHKLNLAKDCPDLLQSLKDQWLYTTVVPSLENDISLAQLEFLTASQRQLRSAPSIQQNDLDQLLADILVTETKNSQWEWWKAFLKWLDSLKVDDYEDEFQWLIRFMQTIKPSEQTIHLFIDGTIALLVIASVWLVINELTVAGFLAKLTGKRKVLLAHQSSLGQGLDSSNARQIAIHQLSPHQQIAVLLEQVIKMLMERELIPADATLTHRQIVHYLSQHAVTSEPAVAHLVHAAEPILYGNRTVAAQTLNDYWRDVQALLGRRLS
jgi:hypothetical protein